MLSSPRHLSAEAVVSIATYMAGELCNSLVKSRTREATTPSMSSPPAPKLTVESSLSPIIYSYSSPIPPNLSLAITSDASRPITLLTYNTPFHPRSGMTQNCFPIWDLSTDSGVETTSVRIQRMPLSRSRGSGDEQYFLTLPPSEKTTVSTRFARGNEDMRPQSKAVAQQEREEAERTGKARSSVFACGVDGWNPVIATKSRWRKRRSCHLCHFCGCGAPKRMFWWIRRVGTGG